MPHVLIVAYGNPMRSDDGVAWRAADALAAIFPESEVDIYHLHQLTPELADTVRNYRCVIFVDAATCDAALNKPGMIRVEEIRGHTSEPASFSHVLSPRKVLDLAAQLYGASPTAFVITVAGDNFNHGDSLSPLIAAVLPELVAQIAELVEQNLSRA